MSKFITSVQHLRFMSVIPGGTSTIFLDISQRRWASGLLSLLLFPVQSWQLQSVHLKINSAGDLNHGLLPYDTRMIKRSPLIGSEASAMVLLVIDVKWLNQADLRTADQFNSSVACSLIEVLRSPQTLAAHPIACSCSYKNQFNFHNVRFFGNNILFIDKQYLDFVWWLFLKTQVQRALNHNITESPPSSTS